MVSCKVKVSCYALSVIHLPPVGVEFLLYYYYPYKYLNYFVYCSTCLGMATGVPPKHLGVV